MVDYHLPMTGLLVRADSESWDYITPVAARSPNGPRMWGPLDNAAVLHLAHASVPRTDPVRQCWVVFGRLPNSERDIPRVSLAEGPDPVVQPLAPWLWAAEWVGGPQKVTVWNLSGEFSFDCHRRNHYLDPSAP